ncbi:Sucrose non-fermenting protein kinase-like protein [Elsinoe fawcettii]|nr:Sucrose non-fermenting protein kinase-like protein [Elsinoe fawcettii]
MTSAFDDEDLSLSITPSNPRRSSKDDRREDMPPPSAPASRQHRPPRSTASSTGTSRSGKSSAVGARDQRLNQYIVHRTLGEGSFGKVKLATHKMTNQKVALKVITRSKMLTRDMAGRIEREIQYLQLLRHPHIIKLYTVVTTPKEIVMVLEYAGGELFDYIVQHGRLPEDRARKFFQQILCAVEYCHRHKIVHRDLKPENLLLDDQQNVKIADFGLSNIMTDGNFLKTSCGSPNYAAPEVISGKLYAGPEVDVWSCGVILYVLLTGRLPFDDEYIPALFKKIQQGTYNAPTYISKEAARLIKRMLQVNPVLRITVQEIRQDPWFTKDLPDYLKPPVEEFVETGVDPNRSIDPLKFNPGVPMMVQEKLHHAVVGKLGKTMGYGENDVQEALSKDEPSAVKDAYLIVRENTIMKNDPAMKDNKDLTTFLAQSPPAYGSSMKGASLGSTPLRQSTQAANIAASSNFDHPRHGSTASSNIGESRSPVSTIGILPSSLPSFHTMYMKGQSKVSHEHSADLAAEDPKTLAKRQLNPHAKGSQINLQKLEKPEAMTPISAGDKSSSSTKKRTTKWQFGIRSRNSPSEAMLAIYRALKSMGAVWETHRIRRPGNNSSPSRQDQRPRQHEGSQSPEYSDSDPDAGTDPEYATKEERERRRARRDNHSFHHGTGSSDDSIDRNTTSRPRRRHRGRDRYGPWNDWGYKLPEDPWIINARFRKGGMYPPGVAHPSSTHSSRADLHEQDARRRSSTVSSATSVPATSTPPMLSQPPSAHGSAENVAASGPAPSPNLRRQDRGDDSVWVYVTIQLYCIEKDSYMVDFKCAGYERLIRKIARRVGRGMDGSPPDPLAKEGGHPGDEHVEKKEVLGGAGEGEKEDFDEGFEGAGRVVGEKDISSPFPFMDVASSLIVNLAQRD